MREDVFLVERVAWLYYVAKKNQREIADLLGTSRSKISRLLKEAERRGVVEYRVHLHRHQYFPEIEMELASLFKLQECIIIPTVEEDRERFFADAAAQYVEKIIEAGDTIGVAWGLTLREVFSRFKTEKDLSSVTVVQLLGGLSAGEPKINPYDITRYFPGAHCFYLYAPAVVSRPETKCYLIEEPQIRVVFELMTRVNKAFLGVGDLSSDASLFKAGFVTIAQMNRLIESGGVGDVVGRYFDLAGRPVKTEMDDRIIGITLDQLRNIPVRVGIAFGERKVKPLVGALRGEYVNVLVTDYLTAVGVLKLAKTVL